MAECMRCFLHLQSRSDCHIGTFMTGEMKLADFGLARAFGSPEAGRYTSQVLAHACYY